MYSNVLINIHKFPSQFALDHPRIRKPSKRQQGIDPLLPITPARARAAPSAIPIPIPHVSFALHQIQHSRNRVAAAVLFTPRAKQHHGPAHQYPPSPTPL
jgi:hypothetical protein